MKLTFLGAGGARTPLVIQSILDYRRRLPLHELCLMDNDAQRLALMKAASRPRLAGVDDLNLTWTTDARRAIQGADFIVTTFRAGLMESRVIDEQVPLKYGVLGQETTGPGGFAMALRTIPVVLDYVRLVEELAPDAWLINFTNPAGIVTEAITRMAGYDRAVGICDNPAAMVRAAAEFLGVHASRLFPEYFGLNHLGWLRAVILDGVDRVPDMIRAVLSEGAFLPGLPFEAELVQAMGAIPNEYLYFYYYRDQAVENLKKAGMSRAQQILPFNQELYASLKRIKEEEDAPDQVTAIYSHYLGQRHGTYMTLETGEQTHHQQGQDSGLSPAGGDGQREGDDDLGAAAEGYTGVTLTLIEALLGGSGGQALILNVPNRGAIRAMADDDVVEVTCFAGHGTVRSLSIGAVPDYALGLMLQVKEYERLTIQAAVEGSYQAAVEALALHPLVPSYAVARLILDDYIDLHGDYFPRLG